MVPPSTLDLTVTTCRGIDPHLKPYPGSHQSRPDPESTTALALGLTLTLATTQTEALSQS